METLWGVLEETQVIMDELTSLFAEQKDLENQKLIMQESKELEEECQKVIEKAQSVILKFMAASTVARPSVDQVNMTDNVETEAPIQGSSTNDVESGINPGIAGDVITPESQAVAEVKPPCAFCNGPHHGIWSCRQFEQKSVDERWNVAEGKTLVLPLFKQGSPWKRLSTVSTMQPKWMSS